MKYWMGIGISNEYIKILKDFPKKVKLKECPEIILILADEPNKNYNNLEKKQLVKDLQNLAKKLNNKTSYNISVEKWSYLSKNKGYGKVLRNYVNLFKTNSSFKEEVLELVSKNRRYFSKGKEKVMAHYVLEEISSIVFLSSESFIKLGPRDKEKDFDNLARKYSKLKDLKFKYF